MNQKCFYVIVISLVGHAVYSGDGSDIGESALKEWCKSFVGTRNVIHGKLCYTVHYESLSWWNAEEACRVQGGKLFKADEEGKVAATFKNGVGLRIWTGAKERDGDRGFYWIDGTRFVDRWNAVDTMMYRIQSWLTLRKLCMSVSIKLSKSGNTEYSWDGQDCMYPNPYACEHDIYNAFKAESTSEDEAPSLERKVPRSRDTNGLRGARISRIVVQHYLIQNDYLFEKRTFASTMCSRLCLHPCQVFNYNTQTGECRGFAVTENKLHGVKNSAWEAWEVVLV